MRSKTGITRNQAENKRTKWTQNKCINDDAKAAARQSLNYIKNKK